MRLKDILSERQITRFQTTVDLKVDISTTSTEHSDQRQGQRSIPDSDLRATVIKATERIVQAYIDGKIQPGQKFHIFDPSNDFLNLVAIFNPNEQGTPENIKIVTAIRSRDFHANDVKLTLRI
jgi:hypothetical protein